MRILKLSGLFIVCLAGAHLAITLLYVLPANMVPAGLKSRSKAYMYPVFDQSWGLFAPVPEVNKKVFFQLEDTAGKQQEWQQFYASYLSDYQSNRFSPRGKFVLALSNTLHYLYGENKEKLASQNLCEGEPASGYFKVLQYMVRQELKNNRSPAQKVRLMVVYQTTGASPQTYCLYYPDSDIY